MGKYPIYRNLSSEELDRKIEEAWSLASPCELCGRKCKAKRKDEKTVGLCKTADKAVVASYGPHFGEEPPLTGINGSGTIFFSFCNLLCIFCQNYDIAHLGRGYEVTAKELAAIMLDIQDMGCHNVNLVSPTHVVPQILEALKIAAAKGLRIPLVYNTGGYDSAATIELLDGVIDIYMPDMKYGTKDAGFECSLVPDYPSVNFTAVSLMHGQVGYFVTDKRGIALRGLIIRHLVLPGGLAGTRKAMEFIAKEIGKNAYINIMGQYSPAYQAIGHDVLGRSISSLEFQGALAIAKELGLKPA